MRAHPWIVVAVCVLAVAGPASDATAQPDEEETVIGPEGEEEVDAPAASKPPPPLTRKTLPVADDADTDGKRLEPPPPVEEAQPEAKTVAVDNAPNPRRGIGPKGEILVSPFGVVRLLYSSVQNDPEVNFVGRNDGFRLQNARFGFDAGWRDRVFVRVSAEGARDERNGPNATEGQLRFQLADAYVDMHVARAMVVRAARFGIVFDIEQLTRPMERAFARRALESRGTFATEGFQTSGLGVRRNLGIAVRSHSILEDAPVQLGYEVAAQNGNGSSDSANDNDALAFSAAGTLQYQNKFFLFFAARFNRRTEGDVTFRRTEDDLGFSGGMRLHVGAVRVAGQLLLRQTEFATTGGPKENAFGGHGEVIFDLPRELGLDLGYRYAILDESDLLPQNRVQEHTVGSNYMLPQYGIRFGLNYTLVLEQSGRELTNNRIEALAEFRL